jgi:hypothetical protein
MELKKLISDTLIQIAEGVNDAKAKYQELGGDVAPKNMKQVEGGIPYAKEIPIHSNANLLSNVQFEVSLTDNNSEGSSTGIGVLLGYFNIGGKDESSTQHQAFTKIKFNIPVKLP